MTLDYKTQHTVKITPEHQEFMTRLVDSGLFESKADIARLAFSNLMKDYPKQAKGLSSKRIDRRTSAYRNAQKNIDAQ